MKVFVIGRDKSGIFWSCQQCFKELEKCLEDCKSPQAQSETTTVSANSQNPPASVGLGFFLLIYVLIYVDSHVLHFRICFEGLSCEDSATSEGRLLTIYLESLKYFIHTVILKSPLKAR